MLFCEEMNTLSLEASSKLENLARRTAGSSVLCTWGAAATWAPPASLGGHWLWVLGRPPLSTAGRRAAVVPAGDLEPSGSLHVLQPS